MFFPELVGKVGGAVVVMVGDTEVVIVAFSARAEGNEAFEGIDRAGFRHL